MHSSSSDAPNGGFVKVRSVQWIYISLLHQANIANIVNIHLNPYNYASIETKKRYVQVSFSKYMSTFIMFPRKTILIMIYYNRTMNNAWLSAYATAMKWIKNNSASEIFLKSMCECIIFTHNTDTVTSTKQNKTQHIFHMAICISKQTNVYGWIQSFSIVLSLYWGK